jgi:hypothetical protein
LNFEWENKKRIWVYGLFRSIKPTIAIAIMIATVLPAMYSSVGGAFTGGVGVGLQGQTDNKKGSQRTSYSKQIEKKSIVRCRTKPNRRKGTVLWVESVGGFGYGTIPNRALPSNRGE